MLSKLISFVIIFLVALNIKAQQSFYAIDTIQKIEIFFTNPNWDYDMDTAKFSAEGYTFADSIKINGVLFDSVGVKYKGNSSYDSTFAKNPLHIELNHFKDQEYNGIEDIKLSNCYKDPSMIREVLAYKILSNYMIAPKANFAQLYINNNLIGLYTNIENISNSFCKNKLKADGNTFVKCNPISNPGPGTKSNLKYGSPHDSTSFYNSLYEIKSDYGWYDLMNLIDTLANNANHLDSILDIDRAMWMLAYNNAFVNLDSYSGVFSQNYYLYKDNNDRFNPIIWDLNMCFGGFPYLGFSNSSLSLQNNTGLKNMSLFIHNGDTQWPLLNAIYSNTTKRKQYLAHVKTLMNEVVTGGTYTTIATQLQNIIDTAVQSDINKFYSYTDFQNAMTVDINVGGYTVPGITNLMSARNTFLQTDTNFTNTQPNISNIAANPTLPTFYSFIDFTATITNSTSNYLGYRYANDKLFRKTIMYDDGAHNDGAAGDGVFGAQVKALSNNIEYYIYAENNLVGIFSPARAEYEFYNLAVNCSTLSKTNIINEVMPSNSYTAYDNKGEADDWVELYASNPTYLGNLFATDDLTNLKKWKFPNDAFINYGDLKIIWCDNDEFQKGLHTNFNLRSDSFFFFAISDSSGNIIDSISYGYIGHDTSLMTCETANSFMLSNANMFSSGNPTFNNYNCPQGINEIKKQNLNIYPNPTKNHITLQSDKPINKIEILDILGNTINSINTNKLNIQTINTSNLASGLYYIRVNNEFYTYKFLKLE